MRFETKNPQQFSSIQFIGISAYVHDFGQNINSKRENDGQGN